MVFEVGVGGQTDGGEPPVEGHAIELRGLHARNVGRQQDTVGVGRVGTGVQPEGDLGGGMWGSSVVVLIVFVALQRPEGILFIPRVAFYVTRMSL